MQKRVSWSGNPFKTRRQFRKAMTSTLSRIAHIIPVLPLKRKLSVRVSGKNEGVLKRIVRRNIPVPSSLTRLLKVARIRAY